MNSTDSPTLPAPTFPTGIFFVTLRLREALPESFMQNLGLQYYTRQLELARHPEQASLLHQTRKHLFTCFDDALDMGKYGHAYLRETELADEVNNEIYGFQCRYGNLLRFTILPNHVHLLIQIQSPDCENLPLDEFDCIQYKPLRDFVESFQKDTEKNILHVLKRKKVTIDPFTFQKRDPEGLLQFEGSFWHERTFDFHVKDQTELEEISWYILKNSQKAELTKFWEDWPYTHW